ncbi:hypothetical protein TESG_08394 [Trichophyton tonsurans CBS 112818]|uniref:Uncharacterized protein n=1 Tax=Trichophyton tonsurans (strain CBS 112818) TaxID=647933 RepID=F2RWA4_TRIT1|nr:hypothetical protein TESG_08394 [Trichophyton tonsurans CBS 112818]
MLRKFIAPKSSTDDELRDLCSEKLGCEACKIEAGPQEEIITPTSPPIGTVAVIINISKQGGALKVHRTSDNSWGNVFIGMIGSDDDEENIRSLVIVPWDAGWYYRSLGDIKLQYVIKGR